MEVTTIVADKLLLAAPAASPTTLLKTLHTDESGEESVAGKGDSPAGGSGGGGDS